MNKQATLLNSLTLVFATTIPLFFWPLLSDTFSLSKIYYFALFAAILILAWIIETIRQQKVTISLSTAGAATLAIVASATLSAVLSTNTQFQLSQRWIYFVALAIIITAGPPLLTLRWKNIRQALTLGAVALSVLTWWQMTALSFSQLLNQILKTNFPTTVGFTTAEAPLFALAFLILMFVTNIVAILAERKQHRGHETDTTLNSYIPTAIVGAGAITWIALMILSNELRPALLPFSAGWSIAVETAKTLPRFFFGGGPESFLAAFHQLRSVGYNTTDWWALRFRVSSSEALHIFTTLGLFGFAAWMTLWGSLILFVKKLQAAPDLFTFTILMFISFFIIPWNGFFIVLFALLALSIIMESQHENTKFVRIATFLFHSISLSDTLQTTHQAQSKKHRGFSWSTALVTSVGLVMYIWFTGKVAAAQFTAYLAQMAAQNGNAEQTYNWQQRSIVLFPYNTQVRRSYGATNLALAQSISEQVLAQSANQENEINTDENASPFDSLTTEQQQMLTQLLQQSIREVRLAAQLNPTETENWEAVATVYSNLLNIEGSADWVIAALVQAIQTDPILPTLRLQLGEIYDTANQPEQAMRYYEQAIQLKPDWHVPYYRYAAVLMKLNQPILAEQVIARAAVVVPPDAADDKTMIEQLQEQIAAAAARAREDAAAQANQENAEQGKNNPVLNQNEPSIPETPLPGDATNASFSELINEPANSDTLQQNDSNNLVLPDDVGF